MNIVQLQEQLKNFSQDQLVREMQMPSGTAPQFLVLGEIMRRQKMQQDFSAQQAKGQPQSTVAEDAIAASGVPQGGIASMARAMAPQTDMAQSTGVQAMAAGGPVKKMQTGGVAKTDPAIIAMANRLGMSVDEYLRSVGEEQAARIEEGAARRSLRDRMVGTEPSSLLARDISFEGVNPSYRERTESVFPPDLEGPVGGPATERQPLYAPMPEQPFTNVRPAGQDIAPVPFADRPGALDAVVPYTAEDFTTTTEDFTRPLAEWWNRPDETVRAIDPYTGKFVDAPTVGTQLRGAGKGVAGLVSTLPTFDPSLGNPYSELTEAEVQALASGDMSPEEADRLQAERAGRTAERAGRTAERAGRTAGRVDRDQQGAAAVPTAEEIEDEKRIAEQPTAPAADTTSTGGGAGGGGAGGAGGAGGGIASAGGMSSFEQELMDALGRREKAANQDKWLALAQVGLNMMSSTQPTLLGAVGEAGLKGVEAARSARDQYDKDRLDLMGAIEQSRLARAAAAARAAGGGGGLANIKPINATILKQYLDEIAAAKSELGMLQPPSEPSFWTGAIDDPDAAKREALQDRIAALENAAAYAYATHGAPYVGSGAGPTGELDANLSD